MTESLQHVLDRVRRPRVHITYDVEIGDAIEMKELPFVVGVLADLSGDRDPDTPLPPIKKRKFVDLDRDNFNEIMEKIAPRLAMQVDNVLAKKEGSEEGGDAKDGGEDTLINALMNFKSMDDFEPVNIIKQIEPMAKLYETRTKLRDLVAKLDGNDNLDHLLMDVLENTDKQSELRKDIDDASSGDDSGGDDAPAKK